MIRRFPDHLGPWLTTRQSELPHRQHVCAFEKPTRSVDRRAKGNEGTRERRIPKAPGDSKGKGFVVGKRRACSGSLLNSPTAEAVPYQAGTSGAPTAPWECDRTGAPLGLKEGPLTRQKGGARASGQEVDSDARSSLSASFAWPTSCPCRWPRYCSDAPG